MEDKIIKDMIKDKERKILIKNAEIEQLEKEVASLKELLVWWDFKECEPTPSPHIEIPWSI